MFNHYQWYSRLRSALRGAAIFAGVAQFLTAQSAAVYTVDPPGSILKRHFHFDTMGFYVQDDWRLTPRLTLNLGMRYEPTTTFAGSTRDLGKPAKLSDRRDDNIGAPFRNPSLRNFSPRFGFAWDVFGNGRTAIRGGFAVLYDLVTLGSALYSAAQYTPPFDNTASHRPAPSRYLTFFRQMPASQAYIAGRYTMQSASPAEVQLDGGAAVTRFDGSNAGLCRFTGNQHRAGQGRQS